MATALELGPEGWKPYIEALRNRPAPVLSPEQVAEREALIAKAREAAAMLKTKYGATRVWLFGSLVHQACFASGVMRGAPKRKHGGRLLPGGPRIRIPSSRVREQCACTSGSVR